MAFILPDDLNVFPHPFLADSNGFLALSQNITPQSLRLSYQFGIFPWYNDGDPVMWWFTHPRFVLFPDNIKISKSMRSIMKKELFTYSFDTCFSEVIHQCQNIRRLGQTNTWITDELKDAFIELYHQGLAHSVEVWQDDKLVGGLYGLALGKVFFGESMFSKVSNASKFGFIKLVEFLRKNNFTVIDCQQETEHLGSLGAQLIPKEDFFSILKMNVFESSIFGPWNAKP